MPLSIAQMRANRQTPRLPERTKSMCLAQDVLAEVESLTNRKMDLQVSAGITANEDGRMVRPDGSPAKASEGGSASEDVAELERIDARLEELFAVMREHTGELTLRAIDSGEWRRWADEHPARVDGHDDQGRPIDNAVDVAYTYGWCDGSALLARLGDFAVAWNGEKIGPEEWGFIRANAAGGDLKACCQLVVEMHESVGHHAPKSLRPSSAMDGAATT